MRVLSRCVAVLGVMLLAVVPLAAMSGPPPSEPGPLELAYKHQSTTEVREYFATIPRYLPRVPAAVRKDMPPLLQRALELYDQFYTREGMASVIELQPDDEYLKAEYWLCDGELAVSVVDDTGRGADEPFPEQAIYSVTLHGVDPGATLGKKVLVLNPYLKQDLEDFLGVATKESAGGGALRLTSRGREFMRRMEFLAPVLRVTADPFTGDPILPSFPIINGVVLNQSLDRAELHVEQYGLGSIVRYELKDGRWTYQRTENAWVQ